MSKSYCVSDERHRTGLPVAHEGVGDFGFCAVPSRCLWEPEQKRVFWVDCRTRGNKSEEGEVRKEGWTTGVPRTLEPCTTLSFFRH